MNLETYFNLHGPFAGAAFDAMPDPHGPNEIGCHDLVALGFLDEALPPHAARDLLLDHRIKREASALLKGIPERVDLWNASDDDSRAANALWCFVEREAWRGLGKVLADSSKQADRSEAAAPHTHRRQCNPSASPAW